VIDSNKILVVAYSVRKMLSRGFKALQALVLESKARLFVKNICKQTY